MMINIQDDILQLAALGLLDRLLVDKATGGHILWATDAYAHLGEGYAPGHETITPLCARKCIPLFHPKFLIMNIKYTNIFS